MGQSALILTLAATLTIVIILVVMGQRTRETDSELAEYQYKVLAREAAATGLNLSVRQLGAEPHRWSDTTLTFGYPLTPHGVGQFSTTVTPRGTFTDTFYGWPDQDTVDIVSVGRISTTGGDTTHIIEARYIKGYTDFGLPPGLKKAMFAEEVLTLNGGTDVYSVNGEDIYVHADGELRASGTPVDVYGYGTYGDGSDGDDPAIAEHIKPSDAQIFDPLDDNPDDLVYADAPIYLPPVDADQMYAANGGDIALGGGPGTTHTFSNDTLRVTDYATMFGCLTCGTADDPLLIYVDGDLIIGNMIIEGYVQFVASGSITFNGSVTAYTDTNGDGIPDPEPEYGTVEWDEWLTGQLDAAGETPIGYYAEGNVTANGNFSLLGQIYANGDVDLNGGGGQTVNVIGGVVSTQNNVTTNGGVNIVFAALSEDVLAPGLNYIVPEGFPLIAYAEW